MKIDTAGIFDLDERTYHGDPCITPSLSTSFAKTMLAATPMHAAAAHPQLKHLIEGLPIDEEEEEAKFDVGRATHAIVTGKGGAAVEVEEASWRTKVAQEARAAANAAGNTALLTHQLARVNLMAERIDAQLRADPDVRKNPFAHRANNELAMIWQEGPIWCRCKPDAIDYDNRIIWDLKTTDGLADPYGWTQTQLKATRIDLRAAFYLRATRILIGPGWRYVFVVAEARRPHAISLVELPGALLETGEDQRHHAVKLFGHCLATGNWKGWASGIHLAEAPGFHETNWVAARDRKPSAAARALALELQAPRS